MYQPTRVCVKERMRGPLTWEEAVLGPGHWCGVSKQSVSVEMSCRHLIPTCCPTVQCCCIIIGSTLSLQWLNAEYYVKEWHGDKKCMSFNKCVDWDNWQLTSNTTLTVVLFQSMFCVKKRLLTSGSLIFLKAVKSIHLRVQSVNYLNIVYYCNWGRHRNAACHYITK